MKEKGQDVKEKTAAPAMTGKSGRADDALNLKQARFVSEYLVDLNGRQAAIRAGYSERSAKQTACRLLGEAAVKAAVGCAMKKRQERTELSQDEVIQDLRELRDICMGRRKVKVMTIVKNSREGTAEPVEVEGVMFEPSSANRALELLGQTLLSSPKAAQTVPSGRYSAKTASGGRRHGTPKGHASTVPRKSSGFYVKTA